MEYRLSVKCDSHLSPMMVLFKVDVTYGKTVLASPWSSIAGVSNMLPGHLTMLRMRC